MCPESCRADHLQGPKGPSGRACSSLVDSGSAAGMIAPACQTKKGAEARCGETISKGRRVTSRLVCCCCQFDVRVIKRGLVAPSWLAWTRLNESTDVSISIDEDVLGPPTYGTWPGVSRHHFSRCPPADRRWVRTYTLHTPSSSLPRSSWREERLLLARPSTQYSSHSATGETVDRLLRALIWCSQQLASAICY